MRVPRPQRITYDTGDVRSAIHTSEPWLLAYPRVVACFEFEDFPNVEVVLECAPGEMPGLVELRASAPLTDADLRVLDVRRLVERVIDDTWVPNPEMVEGATAAWPQVSPGAAVARKRRRGYAPEVLAQVRDVLAAESGPTAAVRRLVAEGTAGSEQTAWRMVRAARSDTNGSPASRRGRKR